MGMVVRDANNTIIKEGDDIMYISRKYGTTPYLKKGIILRIEDDGNLTVRVMKYNPDRGRKVVKLTGWQWRGNSVYGIQYSNIVKV